MSVTAEFAIAAAETWAEVGDSANVVGSTNGADGDAVTGPPCLKFAYNGTTTFHNFERMRSKAYTWVQLGVPAGATVNSVSVSRYFYRRILGESSTAVLTMNLNVVSAGVVVHSAGALETFVVNSGSADSNFQGPTAPNITRAVDAPYQPAATSVSMEVKQDVNANGSGAAGDNIEYDTIDLVINYTAGGGGGGTVNGWVYSSICGAQGHNSDT